MVGRARRGSTNLRVLEASISLAVLLLAVFRPGVSRAADTDVVINEIMYHPDTDCEKEEFIELYNRSQTTTVTLSGWRFSEGVTYSFPFGTQLGPDKYLVVCSDVTAFTSFYSTTPAILLGPWNGHLSNNGEDITLVNAFGNRVDRVRYNDKRPWPISPDGGGPSLELINPNDENSSAGLWRAANANWVSTAWRRYEVTGVATSRNVYFYLDGVGECLIDDVELRATTNPVTNYINNGSFETASPLGWTPTGTHSGSVRVTSDANSGFACLKLVATGAGGSSSGQVGQTCQPLTFNGPRYTLSFWVKGLRPGVILRAGLYGSRTTWAPTASVDIGGATGGGQSYNAGTDTYTVWGAGNDIWGASDQFRFSYATLNGNGALEATVAWVGTPPDPWAKAGIMIRESTAAGSKHAFCLLSRDNGVNFQYRSATNGASATAGSRAGSSPVGLRLTRQGSTFIAEADTGGGFSPLGSVSIAMTSSVLIGFAVTSHAGAAMTTATFAQPAVPAGSGLYTEVSVPSFFATPGSRNSCYSTNTPPYIRDVDSSPDSATSSDPILIWAKITDTDGITSAVLRYQLVRPGRYIRLGDPAYQTSWTTVLMTPGTTPTYYVATLPAQPHRTLVRFRISAQDGAGKVTTVPYSDDSEPNYARYVYDGVPAYHASPRPGVKPYRDHTVLTKVPVFQLIVNAADINEAQTVNLYTLPDWKVQRREFKWYGTIIFNGKVYDHIRFRMRGGTWRYKYNKRMWKFRFNRGHYLDFVHNDGEPFAEELQTLNLGPCIQPPNVPSWLSSKYGDYSQRGEAGIVEKTCFWLWHRVGAIAPDMAWIHFRIVDNTSETGADQFSGDFFGLYLAIQGMDERVLKMSDDRPVGNFYKIDSFGYLPGGPPWFVEANDCALPSPQTDITEFRRQYGPSGGYPTPTQQWWDQNFDLETYYSARSVVDFAHHGDLYPTMNWDGVESGKNYYFYHNPATNKWEIAFWDTDLTFGTDHGDGSSPFRDRVVFNPSFPEFQLAYKNRLREVIQLQFCEEKLFPQIDQWRNLLIEIAEADRDRWDYAPATGPEDFSWQGHFTSYLNVYPSSTTAPLDVRLGDIKYWIRNRINWLANPPRNWWMETASSWPQTTCWDPDIPSTPTLTAPLPTFAFDTSAPIPLRSSAFSDPNGNPHAASKWIATHVGGNELKPDWSSGITTTSLTAAVIPGGALKPGAYWLRVRHMDNTNRWSWWSKIPVAVSISHSTGSITINSGAVYSTATAVTLALTAVSTAPVTQMQFSNDGVTWSGWQAFAPTAPWVLAPADGPKIVYYRFKDGNGTVSAALADTITLETVPPTGSITINSGAVNTKSVSVSLALSATDAGSGLSQMRFSNNGVTWSAWEAYMPTDAWTLAAGDGLKTVYVQFRDKAGNLSANYTDTIRLDTTPPAGTIVINSGAAWTNLLPATLTLSASDGGSGLSQMRFSNDNSTWTAWESYASSKGWTLPAGDGQKTVYVQFNDVAGNPSGSFTDTIGLDTIAPTGSIVINAGAAKTTSTVVTLTLSATDARSGVAQMRFSNDNVTWSTWEAYATQKTWTLISGDGSKIVYARFRDAAGNPSLTYSDALALASPRTAIREWTRYR